MSCIQIVFSLILASVAVGLSFQTGRLYYKLTESLLMVSVAISIIALMVAIEMILIAGSSAMSWRIVSPLVLAIPTYLFVMKIYTLGVSTIQPRPRNS